jgi:hypothetical protein
MAEPLHQERINRQSLPKQKRPSNQCACPFLPLFLLLENRTPDIATVQCMVNAIRIVSSFWSRQANII